MENAEENDAVSETNELSKKLNNGDGGNGTRTDHGFTRFYVADMVNSIFAKLKLSINKVEPDKLKVVSGKAPIK